MKRPIRKIATPSSKPKPRAGAKSGGSAKSAPKGFDRGSAGFQKAQRKREVQDAEYNRRKDTPFGFKLKPGDSAEVIILDKGEPFFLSMHKVKNAQGRWVDEVCIADTGQHCPLCESLGKEGSYTMVCTVLDRRPYKTKDGKTIKVSKKLMFVKGRNLPKFARKYDGNANQNFRGIKITCRRDGEKESSMGEDIEFGGRVSEEFLSKFGDNAKPADYAKIYAIPTAEDLRKRYRLSKGGKSGAAGSEEFEDGNYSSKDVGWGSDDDDE